MKYLLILLFLTGCSFGYKKDAPNLQVGDCYTDSEYSKFGRIVIKPIKSDYPKYANAYLIVTYDRINKDFYFNLRKDEVFDPVHIEKCPFIKSIANDTLKELKAFGLWEEFKNIVKKIK